ncbi:enolase-phosphatase E1 isoform X1 [Procambarus clarkii]|uniref:enolase-phosphatase E1 isoform X1 n=1 Tax=Procambarus clarkii TaxID=6728 RepID=UPI0037438DD6
MDSLSACQSNRENIDPFTGNPIMAPPLSPSVTIAAPPTQFQTDDGMDGVYSANVVSIHSGPSSFADFTSLADFAPPETPTFLSTPETILEEPPLQEPDVNEPTPICPSEEMDVKSPAHKNLGAAIMAGYEEELQKKKSSMNLPEHSLLEFGDTVRDLEEQRRSVIKQMTVKAKRKDTWIKTFNMHDQGKENIPVAPSRSRRKNSPVRPHTVTKSAATSQETIDPPTNGHVVKAEAAMVRSHKNSTDASAPQYNFSKTFKTPSDIVQPVAPPNASLNEKNMLQLEPTVAVAAGKSENVAEEIVITPKNTEILAALFSPPTKTAEATSEHKTSPQSFPKKIVTCVEPEEESKAPSAAVLAHVEVDELVSLAEASSMQSTGSPVPSNKSEGTLVKTQELPVDTAPNLSHTTCSEPHFLGALTKDEEEEEEEENAMVREKNEINLAHMALAKFVRTEVTEENHEAKNIDLQETEEKEEVKIVEEKKTEQEVKKVEEKKAEEKQEAIIMEKREAEEIEVDKVMEATTETNPNTAPEGEVEYLSILDNKGSTKTYWESRMLATMDDGGWESVANVRFQPLPGTTPVIVQTEEEDDDLHITTPSPEFLPAPPPQFDNSPVESEESSPPSLDVPANQPTTAHNITTTHNITSNNTANITTTYNINLQEIRPAKQYIYGISDVSTPKEMRSARVVETVAKKPAQENVIEAEIRAQQVKEVEMLQEGTLKTTAMVGREKGASSPASHDSDEGFVERLAEDAPTVPDAGYTHAIPGNDGEPVIYDAVSPPHQYFSESSPTPIPSSTETKIALEIRELKEREEELRQMRERLMNSSRENLLDDEEARSSASREQLLEDHLTSLTTTTDEGNFSECGDPASSEDKSSDGSNSRIMSPDLHHPGTGLDYTRRKVTVKPFEDEEEDQQPVYTRMQKESVIEREIRLAREREEAFRREKGITNSSLNNSSSNRAAGQPPSTRAPPAVVSNDGRDVQHRLATNRIQLEIQETSIKEKELRDAGKILTMSEDTVDAKVTRMSDFTDQNESPRIWPASSRPCNFSTPSPTPKCSSSPLSPSSPVPNFTPSPALSRGLSRSLSTTNLTSTSSLTNSRAPKGLMQKFIASRGKMTGSAFASPPHTLAHTTSTSRGIPTRPMRVEPKATVIQRETLARMKPTPVDSSSNQDNTSQSQKQTSHVQQQYRRSYCTAEEKIQSELKEMQMREEELRQLRARQLAQSQPNLMDLVADEDDHEDEESEHSFQEMNGLRTTYSNPNLLEDEPNQTQVMDKGQRRRSALIAQWENRIQQTTDT